MSPRRLMRWLLIDLRREPWRFASSIVGVSLAVGILVFLLGVGLGLRSTLLDDLLPLDRLEVAAEGASLGVLGIRFDLGGDTLDESDLERLRAVPGVERVSPKMKVLVPAVASGGGSLLGSGVQTDLVADGIEPDLVADEVGAAFSYVGLETDTPCGSDRDCGAEGYCFGRGLDGRGLCRRYVPTLVSNHVVELYNGSFRRAYGLPRVDPEALVGFTFEMSFGDSAIRGRGPRTVSERMRLVGYSDQAISLGVTLPLAFVREVNSRLGPAKSADRFHSAVVMLESPASAPAVLAAVDGMNLEVSDRGARRAANMMALLLALLGTVGAVVLAVASVSVAHAFFIIVASRRRELAVLRALGASRGQVRALFLTQGALVGAVAGVLGGGLAWGAARLVDALGRSWVPDFPYKPESFFLIEPWLLLGAVAVAMAACVLGAAAPIVRAISKDPAEALIE